MSEDDGGFLINGLHPDDMYSVGPEKNLLHKTEYLLFYETRPDNRKTKFIEVWNKKDLQLGHISWWGAWRKYIFSPRVSTIYDSNCLQDIINMIKNLMEERRGQA